MSKRGFLPGGRVKVRRFISAVALPAIAVASLAVAAPAAATEEASGQTLTIGVDNISPNGQNFGFLDYYPREGINVRNGDVVGFNFTPPASSDEIHTATLGKPEESVKDTFNHFPQIIIDADDSASQLQFPNQVLFASNPPPQVGGCGDAAHPCTYDGTSEINSGILCKAFCPAPSYFYKIQVPNVPEDGLTVHFVCLIHGPVMSGTLKIVAGDEESSTQADLNHAARAQYAPQRGQGRAAKKAALAKARASHKVLLGAESTDGHVQVLEMLPGAFRATAGQQVNFAMISTNEIHTATFPRGHGSDSVEPIPLLCEAFPNDVAFVPPTAGPPCGDPSKFENHVNPQPQGATSIDTPTTIGSSGILALFPPFPFSSYNFSFPNAGTFAYQCRIHDHMVGTIVVSTENDNGDHSDRAGSDG